MARACSPASSTMPSISSCPFRLWPSKSGRCPMALFGLRHVSESAGTPDNIIADLRNLPLPVCLHEFGMDDTACDEKVLWIVRAGLTTLPHVHGHEIGTNGRLGAV